MKELFCSKDFEDSVLPFNKKMLTIETKAGIKQKPNPAEGIHFCLTTQRLMHMLKEVDPESPDEQLLKLIPVLSQYSQDVESNAEKKLELTLKRLRQKGYCTEKITSNLFFKSSAFDVTPNSLFGANIEMLCNFRSKIKIFESELTDELWYRAIEIVASCHDIEKVLDPQITSLIRVVEPYINEINITAILLSSINEHKKIVASLENELSAMNDGTHEKEILNEPVKKQKESGEINAKAENNQTIKGLLRTVEEQKEEIKALNKELSLMQMDLSASEKERREAERRAEKAEAIVIKMEKPDDGLEDLLRHMLAVRSSVKETAEGTLLNTEPIDAFPGEQKEFVLHILQQAIRKFPEQSRAYELAKSILDNNVCGCEGAERLKTLKALFLNSSLTLPRLLAGMQAIGYEVLDEDGHVKISLENNPRYTYILSKTPSDWREDRNNYAEIKKSIAVNAKI